MRRPHLTRARAALVGLALVATTVTACGSSSDDSAGSDLKVFQNSAALVAAQQAITPYIGHPSGFPATEPLTKRPGAGSEFDFLQCSAPVCALFANLMSAPAQALGVKLDKINTGSSANTSPAAATALSNKPAALLVGASNPQLYGDYLHKLTAAGSVVVGGGTVGGKSYGIQEAVGGEHDVSLAGSLLADWVLVRQGPRADVVFYSTPELTFSAKMQAAFSDELAKRCPSCKASFQTLSVTTFGTTAPGQVVSYLQSHPTTNTVVFASMEGATGLSAALRNAHVSPTTVGFAPTPSNLQDIAQGGLPAGLALDINVQVWLQFNLAARLLANQATPESNLEVDLQFLSKDDVAGKDVSHGWTLY